jgi:hypothetical protein
MWRLFAFWKDFEDRESQIKDGLGKVWEACIEGLVPPLVLIGMAVMVVLHVSNPTVPLLAIGLIGVGYVSWWGPYCYGKARNQMPKILGREPTKALGDARFGELEDVSELGYDGSRGGIYVGIMRDE